MTLPQLDPIAVYAAGLASVLAIWEFVKHFLERPRLRVTCYAAQMITPGIGVSADDLLAYRLANPGGKPIVVTTVGGVLRGGKYFLFGHLQLPLTLQPNDSIVLSVPMPPNVGDIKRFIVHDGLGKQWTTSTAGLMKQLAARRK